ncbi:MAG: GNAT family N-acetyltransferase [Oscillospiraceae bacterium]
MIQLSEFLQSVSEPFIGSEIITLAKCFGNEWQRFCIYKNENNSNIVRFENRLLISGDVDTEEIIQFARMTGIAYIEGLRRDFSQITKADIHSIMVYEGEKSAVTLNCQSDNTKQIFNILKISDSNFSNKTNYDEWLSFIRRKQSMGLCTEFLYNNSVTAAISARGLGFSLISDVATIPSMRNNGLATALLADIASAEKLSGFTPFVVSENYQTDGFYKKSHFKKCEEKIIITI